MAQPEAESNVTVKASCYNLAPAKGDPGFISSRTCAGVEGRAEGGVLFSLHIQTAMKGTPYVHAFRLYAKSPCDSRREVRGASSELSAGGSAEKQNARPCTTWASIAQAPPGPKPGPRHSEETLVLKKSGLHVCIHSRAHHCATYAPPPSWPSCPCDAAQPLARTPHTVGALWGVTPSRFRWPEPAALRRLGLPLLAHVVMT